MCVLSAHAWIGGVSHLYLFCGYAAVHLAWIALLARASAHGSRPISRSIANELDRVLSAIAWSSLFAEPLWAFFTMYSFSPSTPAHMFALALGNAMGSLSVYVQYRWIEFGEDQEKMKRTDTEAIALRASVGAIVTGGFRAMGPSIATYLDRDVPSHLVDNAGHEHWFAGITTDPITIKPGQTVIAPGLIYERAPGAPVPQPEDS